MKKLNLLLPIAVALGGCASQAVLIGEQPSEPAPHIVFLGAHDGKGQDYLTWENVSSFGPVPATLQAKGDLDCMRIDTALRAVGYHPSAKDRSGQTIKGGGYFCQPTLGSAKGLTGEPPRMLEKDGRLTWDRPSAFGPVPASESARAVTECHAFAPKARPLGYHPRALDMQGNAIPNGGFLCVE